jgi:hypothetical protein
VKQGNISFALLITLLMVGLIINTAGSSENAPQDAIPVATAIGNREVFFPQQKIVLEPFYLIQEKHAKVWIERVILTLNLDQLRKLTTTFNHPHQRSMIFELITSHPEPDLLPTKVQAALNHMLGDPIVTAVHLSRSFLLL